jgi:hypothetical protein
MYLQMDPLANPVRTRPIETSWERSIEQYPNQQFEFIDDPDPLIAQDPVPTQTQT